MDVAGRPAARTDAFVLVGLALLVGTTVLRAYQPYTFLFRDGAFYAQTNRSIARSFTLRQEQVQPRSWYRGDLPWYHNLDDAWSNISVGRNGEWYPKHSYLMPLFATPFFVTLGSDGLLLFNALAMVFALFSGYFLASRIVSPPAAAVAVFLVATSPLVTYLSYSYSHDVFCAALVSGGAALLSARRARLGGFSLGLAVVAKVTNLLIVVPLALALIAQDRRALLRAAFAGLVPLAAYALANTAMYGAPWITSYQRILMVRNGVQTIETYRDAFETPLIEGLARFFSRSAEGELGPMAALPLAAYAGLVFLRAYPRLAVALGVSLAGFLVVFAKFRYGGARFFMPWLAVSTVPAAALLSGAVSGASAIRDRVYSRLSRRARTLALPAVAAVAAIAVGVAWGSGRPGPTNRIAEDVERLEVRLDDVPCDYFNLAYQKWECSHLDPGARFFVGLALAEECAGMQQPALVLPAHPGGRTRWVRWAPRVSGQSVRIAWIAQGPTAEEATFGVRLGSADEEELHAGPPNQLQTREFVGAVGPENPIVLRVPPSGGTPAVFCVAIEVDEG